MAMIAANHAYGAAAGIIPNPVNIGNAVSWCSVAPVPSALLAMPSINQLYNLRACRKKIGRY